MTWVLISLCIGLICGAIFIATLSSSPRASSSALAWLIIIVFVPILGVPLFFVFGGRKILGIIEEKRYLYDLDNLDRENLDVTERILSYSGIPPAKNNNKMQVIGSGEQAYNVLMGLLNNAKRCIAIQTYIVGNDEVGDAILEKLCQRARDGLRVRFLLDGLYAFVFPKKKIKQLRAAGVEVYLFLPLKFRIFRSRINLRNHRKVAIIDGEFAVMGGMNLAKNYMGPVADKDRWCDIALSITGDTVGQLNQLFNSDWEFASGKKLERLDCFVSGQHNYAPIQAVASGPDVHGDPFYNSLLINIYNARQHIDVVTPYFVPDLALVKALSLAALRGVHITLIVPRHSNHGVADLARSRHIRILANAGVRILFFEPTMIHAKAIVIDRSLAIVGSANFDMRSLFFNFESCLYLYGENEVTEIGRWIEGVKFRCSDKRTLATPGKLRLLMENLALLMAPLL